MGCSSGVLGQLGNALAETILLHIFWLVYEYQSVRILRTGSAKVRVILGLDYLEFVMAV
jgi:hypothetical protein